MVLATTSGGALVLRLIVGLVLLGWPGMSSAAGTWSVISLPQQPVEGSFPTTVVTDAAGDLYVAAVDYTGGWIQKRDAQGNWSVIATGGVGLGQVDECTSLAVDNAGNLYVADMPGTDDSNTGRIQKRDGQGDWSLIATGGKGVGQVNFPGGLAIDAEGNLYVGDWGRGLGRIQKRDAQGTWSVIATMGSAPGEVLNTPRQAVDAAGNLYVAESDFSPWGGNSRVQKRDTQGNWSVIVLRGTDLGQVNAPYGIGMDSVGNLYIADFDGDGDRRIQKRDAQGNWSVMGSGSQSPGQPYVSSPLAVDGVGNLYVADSVNDRVRVLVYTPEFGP